MITPDWLWGDVGSNPAHGKFSFNYLLLIYIYIWFVCVAKMLKKDLKLKKKNTLEKR